MKTAMIQQRQQQTIQRFLTPVQLILVNLFSFSFFMRVLYKKYEFLCFSLDYYVLTCNFEEFSIISNLLANILAYPEGFP